MAPSEYEEYFSLTTNSLLIGFQDDSSKCSVFSFDINANRSRLPLAKNALRKLRTMRHPGVVKVIDTVEVGMLRAGLEDSSVLMGGSD